MLVVLSRGCGDGGSGGGVGEDDIGGGGDCVGEVCGFGGGRCGGGDSCCIGIISDYCVKLN